MPRPKLLPADTHPAEAPLHLPAALEIELGSAAARAWPREACGLLVGKAHADTIAVGAIHPARNLAADAGRFDVDPRDILEAEAEARRRGLEIVGVWHSHPTAAAPRASDAAPSALDAAAAWPGWRWLIAAGGPGGEPVLRAWRWVDGQGVEIPILSDERSA